MVSTPIHLTVIYLVHIPHVAPLKGCTTEFCHSHTSLLWPRRVQFALVNIHRCLIWPETRVTVCLIYDVIQMYSSIDNLLANTEKVSLTVPRVISQGFRTYSLTNFKFRCYQFRCKISNKHNTTTDYRRPKSQSPFIVNEALHLLQMVSM